MSKADDLRKDVQSVNKAITAIEEMTVPVEHRCDDILIARSCIKKIRSSMMQEIRLLEIGTPKDSPVGPPVNTAANRPVPEPEPVIEVQVPQDVLEKVAERVTEPEEPEVEVSEESGEFWSLEDIKPLSKPQLIEVAEQENIKIDKKATKPKIFAKVKKGLGL